ncbi:hypothetical protein ElyMa_001806700 [Elysia marginata]|uniref:Uncharacterized protein n=1 Tax=Elysia marginata TaxID=1093978 RepID=A0AAV4EHY0_9GAST|nr:hypothetical protein ElyMa_001806700 [Elysia marginata]
MTRTSRKDSQLTGPGVARGLRPPVGASVGAWTWLSCHCPWGRLVSTDVSLNQDTITKRAVKVSGDETVSGEVQGPGSGKVRSWTKLLETEGRRRRSELDLPRVNGKTKIFRPPVLRGKACLVSCFGNNAADCSTISHR